MPKREVLQSITIGLGKVEDGKDLRGRPVYRSEQRLKLRPGQVYDFTEEQLEYLARVAPNAVTSKMTVDLDNPDSVAQLNAQLGDNEVQPPSVDGQVNTGGNDDDF